MPADSMEKIAQVVADIKKKQYTYPPDVTKNVLNQMSNILQDWEQVQDAPTIDATAIYQQAINDKNPWHVYEDHECIAPPWSQAFVGFVNQWGNVIVTFLSAVDVTNDAERTIIKNTWVADQPVTWEQVRWALSGLVWMGGIGGGHSSELPTMTIPTMGPMYVERYLIADDGAPLDIKWAELQEGWHGDMAESHLRVNLDVLNFMNCKNVDIVPARTTDRAQRRRLQRMGVSVSTINVFPVGKLRRGSGASPGGSEGTPFTPVRGHYAHYGEKYGRKKLFGKYEGRFYIPQHARGSKEVGEVTQRFDLHPE